MQPTNTQQQAQQSIKLSSKQMRAQVFEYIMQCGSTGATNEEIAEATGMKLQTVCARKNELFKKHLVVDLGTRRSTKSGRSASVWIVPRDVRQALILRKGQR